MKALIVGAGIAGLTAGILLKRKGWDVTVLDTRMHCGGNCFDYIYNGVHVHQYGPHIFHTSDFRVNQFISEFTSLTPYLHKVMAQCWDNKIYPIPYSKATAELIGRDLTDEEIRQMFFWKYSEKMWGLPFAQIPEAITSRVNLRRDSFDSNYFLDKWQGMPSAGYNQMFMRMVGEIGISRVHLGVQQTAWRHEHEATDLTVFTGRLDEFYDFEFGMLPYRAIEFEFKHAQPRQPYAVLNYCNDMTATRITDFGRFYDRPVDLTVTCTEYPTCWNEDSPLVPSYPLRGFAEPDHQVSQYMGIFPGPRTVLAGRLGTYKYMNMDAVIADTMHRLEQKLGEKLYA